MADTSTAGQDMHEYVVWYSSGGMNGRVSIPAPDAATARADLEARPWRYGLHERATALHAMRRVVIEPEPIRGR